MNTFSGYIHISSQLLITTHNNSSSPLHFSNMEVMVLVVMSSLKSWIIPCLLTFLACHLWSVWLLSCKDQGCQLPLPPGSMGLPLVGETLNLVMKVSYMHNWWSATNIILMQEHQLLLY